MNGAFVGAGEALCNGYASVAGQAPEMCLGENGLFTVGATSIGLVIIVSIVVAWRVFL